MVVSAVSNASGLLSDDFSDADFEMYDKVMSGIEEKEPRWKRAMNLPNSMLGEAVGELYVNKYFPEESKAYMKKLIDNKGAIGGVQFVCRYTLQCLFDNGGRCVFRNKIFHVVQLSNRNRYIQSSSISFHKTPRKIFIL